MDDFVRKGETYWDGVRNYQARNNLRAMKQGDLVFFYHSVSDKSLENIALIKQSLLSVMPSPRRSSAASSSWARPSCADAAPGQAAQPNNSPSPKKRLSSAWPFSTESEA